MRDVVESSNQRQARDVLADPALRRDLEAAIGARVPAHEVDDLVQATLVAGLAAADPPADPAALRRWLFGIARHAVADHYRRGRRELPLDGPEPHAPSAPHDARDLERWLERSLPDGDGAARTVEWMMLEGDGEKLEAIAAAAELPAATVRQRVSRLRRLLRARWIAELAAAAALGALALVAWLALRRPANAPVDIAPDTASAVPEPTTPAERGRELRRVALERCREHAWRACLDGLDAAAGLDPAGDETPEARDARREATGALSPRPTLSAPVPSSTNVPAPPPTDAARPPKASPPSPSGLAPRLRAPKTGPLGS